jgi:hypothetical protein
VTRFVYWWEKQSEWLRWLLYLPMLVVLTLFIEVPVFLLIRIANREIWGEVVKLLVGGALLGFLWNSLSLWLAPRWKIATTIVVSMPIHFIGIATIITYIANKIEAVPSWASPINNPMEFLWGITWLVTSFLVIRSHHRENLS